MALVPGLVNGHTHAAMTLFRGHGGDLPLMEWLEKVIWPVEARLDADDVYWGTRLACVEMIRTGTVRFWDMYWHAGRDGSRGRGRRASGHDRRAADRRRRRRRARGRCARRPSAAWSEIGAARELIAPALAPARHLHGRASRRCAGSPRRPRSGELPVHIHLSETEDEVARCVEAHGAAPGRVPRPARAARAADACLRTGSGSTTPSSS